MDAASPSLLIPFGKVSETDIAEQVEPRPRGPAGIDVFAVGPALCANMSETQKSWTITA